MLSRTDELKKIRDEIFSGTHLPLYEERTKNKVFPVLGEGNHEAKIMFVGEAPGRNEAATGRPFCGAAGKVLDELFNSIGMSRKDVYVTNIVKDRPPENRDPFPEEIQAYGPYLDRQIEIIQPQVIAGLGRFSSVYLMDKFSLGAEVKSISVMHGKLFKTNTSYGNIYLLPLYHPAAAIYTRSLLEELKKDFQILKKFI